MCATKGSISCLIYLPTAGEGKGAVGHCTTVNRLSEGRPSHRTTEPCAAPVQDGGREAVLGQGTQGATGAH